MADITRPSLLYFKAGLFVLGGGVACGLILLDHPRPKVALLLATAVWCFARAYYFAFYVVQHYVDDRYRFAGLTSFVRYVVSQRGGGKRAVSPTVGHPPASPQPRICGPDETAHPSYNGTSRPGP
jgi:hypothetical protein